MFLDKAKEYSGSETNGMVHQRTPNTCRVLMDRANSDGRGCESVKPGFGHHAPLIQDGLDKEKMSGKCAETVRNTLYRSHPRCWDLM